MTSPLHLSFSESQTPVLTEEATERVDDNKVIARQLLELEILLKQEPGSLAQAHLLDVQHRYSTLFQLFFERANELTNDQIEAADKKRSRLAEETNSLKAEARHIDILLQKETRAIAKAESSLEKLQEEVEKNTEAIAARKKEEMRCSKRKRKALEDEINTLGTLHLRDEARTTRFRQQLLQEEEEIFQLQMEVAALKQQDERNITLFKEIQSILPHRSADVL